jgi:hypothetical protein
MTEGKGSKWPTVAFFFRYSRKMNFTIISMSFIADTLTTLLLLIATICIPFKPRSDYWYIIGCITMMAIIFGADRERRIILFYFRRRTNISSCCHCYGSFIDLLLRLLMRLLPFNESPLLCRSLINYFSQ